MKRFFQKKPAIFQRAAFLSPKDLMQRAGAIIVLFLLLHFSGLREFTSILNGTVGSVTLGWQLSGVLALIYIAAYLAVVVLAPIMILAAIILAVWQCAWKPGNGVGTENHKK